MLEFLALFQKPAIVSEQLKEAPAPRAAIEETYDYLCLAVVDANGRRLKEKRVRRALRLLETL